MPLAPTGKFISLKQRTYCYLTSRKVPCAGRDFFDRSSLLAHDTPYEVGFSVVERCRPGGQHIKIPPNSNGFGGHQPISGTTIQPTKNTVFLLGGLAIFFLAKLNKKFNLL